MEGEGIVLICFLVLVALVTCILIFCSVGLEKLKDLYKMRLDARKERDEKFPSHCYQCGRRSPAAARFCGHCGKAFIADISVDTVQAKDGRYIVSP
jgi:hypothetical protein